MRLTVSEIQFRKEEKLKELAKAKGISVPKLLREIVLDHLDTAKDYIDEEYETESYEEGYNEGWEDANKRLKNKFTDEHANCKVIYPVEEMQKLYDSGIKPEEIAEKYNLCTTVIRTTIKTKSVKEVKRLLHGTDKYPIEKWQELSDKGWSANRISKKYDVSSSTVLNYIKVKDISDIYKVEDWQKLYDNGWTSYEIGKKYGINESTVRRRLKNIRTVPESKAVNKYIMVASGESSPASKLPLRIQESDILLIPEMFEDGKIPSIIYYEDVIKRKPNDPLRKEFVRKVQRIEREYDGSHTWYCQDFKLVTEGADCSNGSCGISSGGYDWLEGQYTWKTFLESRDATIKDLPRLIKGWHIRKPKP